jgi:NNP family nitrate/nitrite transporter-like MFS transporter
MLFSAITVNLNKVGFNFTTDQLFMLTALPSLRCDIARPLFLYGADIWRTLLDGIKHRHPDCSLRLAGFAIQNTATLTGSLL